MENRPGFDYFYGGESEQFSFYRIPRQLIVGPAVKLLAELDTGKGIGLIQRVKQGQGKPARIYVKRFTTREAPQVENPSPPSDRNPDFGKTEVQTSENRSVIILTRIRLKGIKPIYLSSQ